MQRSSKLIEKYAKPQAFKRIESNLCSYVFMSVQAGVTTCTLSSTDFTGLPSWKEL